MPQTYRRGTRNSSEHKYRGCKHSFSSKNKCSYFPVFLCLFELFRRDLNEVKAAYTSEYYLVCHFVIITMLQLYLNFWLSLLRIDSHRGREGERRQGMKTKMRQFSWYRKKLNITADRVFGSSVEEVLEIKVPLDISLVCNIYRHQRRLKAKSGFSWSAGGIFLPTSPHWDLC